MTLNRNGVRELFEGRIHSADDVRRGKPAPDLFLRAADRMGRDATDLISDMADLVPAIVAAR